MEQKLTILDFTQSRDCEEDQQNLPVTDVPTINVYVTVRLHIIFFQQNYFDEIGNTPTYAANIIYPAPSLLNSLVTISTLHIYDIALLYQDQQLQEFLDCEVWSHNFINQDLTFLQPSTGLQNDSLR